MPSRNLLTFTTVILLAVVFAVAGCTPTISQKKREKPSTEKVVEFYTTEGLIEISLYPKNAPKSCEQFLSWCEGVEVPGSNYKDSLYLGNNFYNVEPDIFIQTGDVFNQGRGAELFEFDYEKTYVPAEVGSVFFVKDANTNKNNSIFAVLLIDNPKLTDVYTIFGKVTKGLDICYKISNLPTNKDEELGIKTPVQDIKIERVIINAEQ